MLFNNFPGGTDAFKRVTDLYSVRHRRPNWKAADRSWFTDLVRQVRVWYEWDQNEKEPVVADIQID